MQRACAQSFQKSSIMQLALKMSRDSKDGIGHPLFDEGLLEALSETPRAGNKE